MDIFANSCSHISTAVDIDIDVDVEDEELLVCRLLLELDELNATKGLGPCEFCLMESNEGQLSESLFDDDCCCCC